MTRYPLDDQALHVDGRATGDPQWVEDDPQASAPQRPAPGTVPVPNVAICPVKGCGLTVRQGTDAALVGCAPRELVIEPARAYEPYVCSCPRRALLDVGRTADKRWTLSEHRATQAERAEMNLIAHALVTGQTRERGGRASWLTSTAPHPSSDRMARAHLAAHQLYRQMSQALFAGQHERALELGQQANAADYAYRLHERAYRREERRELHEATWQHAEYFYIELDSPQPQAEARYHAVFTFRLQALWNEERGRWDVENAQEIELWSGIAVDADGWRNLMALLVYLRDQTVNGETASKPGVKAEPHHLIYRRNGKFLSEHPYIEKKFPRALVALEALRRTLEYDTRVSAEPRQPLDWLWQLGLGDDWAADQVQDRASREEDALPRRSRPHRPKPETEEEDLQGDPLSH